MKYYIRTKDYKNDYHYFVDSENIGKDWIKDRNQAKEFDNYLDAVAAHEYIFSGEIVSYPVTIFEKIIWFLSFVYVCLILVPFIIIVHTLNAILGVLANFTQYNHSRTILPDELLSKIGTGTMSYGFLKIMLNIIQPIYQSFYELKSSLKSIRFF